MKLFMNSPKLYPSPNDSSLTNSTRTGDELRNAMFSKTFLHGHQNKFTGFLDASQRTHERRSMEVSKQVQYNSANKTNSLSALRSRIRKARNAGCVVPKKVQARTKQ